MKLKITTLVIIEGNQVENIKGIKNYFDSVTIETQELIPIGFKNTLLNRETK